MLHVLASCSCTALCAVDELQSLANCSWTECRPLHKSWTSVDLYTNPGRVLKRPPARSPKNRRESREMKSLLSAMRRRRRRRRSSAEGRDTRRTSSLKGPKRRSMRTSCGEGVAVEGVEIQPYAANCCVPLPKRNLNRLKTTKNELVRKKVQKRERD